MLDTENTKHILRIGLVAIIMSCAVVTRWVVNLIHSPRLRRMARRLFWMFVIFSALKMIAAGLDTYLNFEVAWFSTAVTYMFDLWILWLVYKLYRRFKVQEYEIHKSGEAPVRNPKWIDRQRVSELTNELLDELQINITRTNHLEKNITSHLGSILML